jgi:hypothetical protein
VKSQGLGFAQALLVGLPLTGLVGIAAIALWSLSAPVRTGPPVPGSPFAAKAHASPLHFLRR